MHTLIAVVWLLLSAVVHAQDETGEPTLEPAAVRAVLEQINDAATPLEDAARVRAREAAEAALAALGQATENGTATTGFRTAADTARQELDALRARLDDPPKNEPTPMPSVPIEQLQTMVASAEAAETAAKREFERLTTVVNALAERRPLAPRELVEAENAVAEPAAAIEPDLPTVVATALSMRNTATALARQTLVERLQTEVDTFEQRLNWRTAQRDLAERAATSAATEAERWRDHLESERLDAAKQAQSDAVTQAEAADPLLVELTTANAALARRRADLVESLTKARDDRADVQELDDGIRDRFEEIDRRVQVAGLTEAIGLQLRRERDRLPEPRPIEQRIRERRSVLVSTQLQQIEDEYERARLRDLETRAREFAAQVPVARRATVEAEALQAYTVRRGHLDTLIRDGRSLEVLLVQLDADERALLATVESRRQFIAERVLWIRSSKALWSSRWSALPEAAIWLADPSAWFEFALSIGRGAREPRGIPLVVLALGLLVLRPRARARLAQLTARAKQPANSSLTPTIWAAVATAFLALPFPFTLWVLARLATLGSAPDDSFGHAIALGMNAVFWPWFGLAWVRNSVRQHGLAEHFRWPVEPLAPARRIATLVIVSVTPPLALMTAFDSLAERLWDELPSRLLLTATVVPLAIALRQAVGLWQSQLSTGAPVRRVANLAAFVSVAVPTAFVLLAITGYSYTAKRLFERFEQTLGALIVVAFVHQFVSHWILLARRRLAFRRAVERLGTSSTPGSDAAAADAPPPPADLDIGTVNAQTKTLLAWSVVVALLTAVATIWADVAPALNVFDDYRLWTETEILPNEDGSGSTVERVIVITLGDLLASFGIAFVTWIAVRNLPGLLELTILSRTRLGAGERNAVITLAKYAVTVIGVVIAFRTIGLGWSKVQWLVAAVSVGLGFGLQEIFANFVSGLIILLERPIRVGDLVTVGGIDGYVTRIRMRATTIRDYNRKELIVPNREFVTAQLVNWTLSDPTTRLVIRVGVAYGTDPARVRDLLHDVATNAELVLDDPKPRAVFTGFGASSLDFELRIFIKSPDDWPTTLNSVHDAIASRFEAAGVVIAFPQLDVHLQSATESEQTEPAQQQNGRDAEDE